MATTPLTDAQIEAEARALYEQDYNQVKPRWDQLGETTKLVWRGFVLAGQQVGLC